MYRAFHSQWPLRVFTVLATCWCFGFGVCDVLFDCYARPPSHSGMCLPGTAEPTGKASETAKGNLQHLQPGASVCYDIEVGALDSARAKATQTAIAELLH